MDILTSLVFVALGTLFALRPKMFWWLWRGWMAGNREPAGWELLRSRAVGVCFAAAGVFGLYWMLTHK